MRAVIASMGALFDHDQFAAFIQELYAQDTYRSLRAPAIDVITANLQTFKANDYTLVDDELLANVPDFRDHLLATLMEINCRKKSTISQLSAGGACDCFFARATPHKVHPKDACSVFINQNFILSSIEEQFLNSSYSDVTLVCGEHEFPAHRAILCSSSKYFLDVCNGNLKEASESSGKIQLDDHDPLFVKNALEFLYKGRYTEISVGLLHPTKSIPFFHARMFAVADYLDIEELMLMAIDLTCRTLVENLEQDVFVSLVRKAYTQRVNSTELRLVLVENLFESIIRSPLWDWGWIEDLYDEPHFGRDLLFFSPVRRELEGIGKMYLGDEAVKKCDERLARINGLEAHTKCQN
ncbi:uncharacterized protein N7529_007073 [Penicillium soppii]|uniref:uncharacterized protein n=1 Tax=Penicillium soppii TaxID=69789 RepID=UPI002547090B|nr:uncharacterized protein N7529_007073 [Penicillium soppii]KAJ5865157.1 hypothetical protein N7529_007073 [Penicillium soppii]